VITKHFKARSRLSIPACGLLVLLLTVPALPVSSAPALSATAETAAAAPGAVIAVTTQGDEFGGPGLGCSLREAIQAANTDSSFGGCAAGSGTDTITLPAGTYTLTGAADENDNATGDLDVKSNLTIYGADEKTTFIQAGTDATNGVDRVLHIFDGYAVGINDVTIRYGKAPDGVDGADDVTCTGGHGGGIYSGEDTTLILNDCVVAYNRTGDGGDGCTYPSSANGRGGAGGGIYIGSGTLTLNDTTVRNNETGKGGDGHIGGDARYGGNGGGICLYNGEATLTDSLISSNVTGAGGRGSDVASGTAGDGATSGYGGGIFGSGTLTLIESTVAGNATGAGGDGGDSFSGDGGDGGLSGSGAGIINYYATLVVVESAIYDNATGPGGSGGSGPGSNGIDGYPGYGGGISSMGDADATLRDTTIRDNSGTAGGGLSITGGSSVVTLDSCTISGNTAGGNGGGLYNSGTLTMTNSTTSGNDANTSGGGIYNAGTATLTFVTITDNTADLDNNGFGNGGGFITDGTLTMTNTIVAVNYDKGGESPDCYGTVASGDYNLLGTGDSANCTFTSQPHDQVGTTASPLNPILSILSDNGGPTPTHAMKANGPAANRIPAGVNGCVAGSRDQRGVLRLPLCDIGAYEIDPETVYLPLVLKD
jgi:CSLREA domain-containing protein